VGEPLRVLIVEDSEDDAVLLARELRREGYEPVMERVETAEAMADALASGPWDLVLADYNLPRFGAPAAMAMLKQSGLDVPFIIVSGAIGEETAVAAMKAGAHDYVMKDRLARLVPAVQRELREAQDRRQRRRLEQQTQRAEKLAALGTLAAGIAHELNNPIGIMASRIEVMLLESESASLPPQLRQDLEVLHRQALRAGRIAQGLLSFARQSTRERVPMDLNHVVEETLFLAEKGIGRAGIELRVALAPSLPAIVGDADGLGQVVLNLLTNARDAIEGQGAITVETRTCPDRPGIVELIVSDTGRGIALDAIPRIFDPFFTMKPKGTGLGLSISDGIVREHGGTIDVQSAVGRGTTFILSFPALAPPAPPARA
jgi:signal transduction histidine kinase